MDAVSYAHSAKQAKRIKKFIENPDSNSGIVTVPKVIEAGESVTVPAGRVAVLPNVQVDGELNVEAGGEVFIPSGATFDDLESQIAERQLKSELAYNVDTSSYIPNTLTSGAIIERGSNSNGGYVKYADGTLIMKSVVITTTTDTAVGSIFTKLTKPIWTFPHTAYIPIGQDSKEALTITVSTRNVGWATANTNPTSTSVLLDVFSAVNARSNTHVAVAIGRWK